MKQEIQRRHWKRNPESESQKEEKQKTIDGKLKFYTPKSYLVESFVLNSVERIVSKKGKGRTPDLSYAKSVEKPQNVLQSLLRGTGGKVKQIDLDVLGSLFKRYTQTVNLLLSRMYAKNVRAESLGQKLSEYKGRAYTLLRKEKDLSYQHNQEIKDLVFERLYRNALEHAGRTLLADWTRRQLFNAAIKVLIESSDDVLLLLRRKRIDSGLVRRVRDSCDSTKNNGSGFHYTLGVLRQLRLAIDKAILEETQTKITWRGRQRKHVVSLLKDSSPKKEKISSFVKKKIADWELNGYPFTIPYLKSHSLDFAASTENSPGQGYWFSLDEERENEVLLHLKLPPGIDGFHHEASPYKGKTLTFRFLDWMPRAAVKDRVKAENAKDSGALHRAQRLNFRAALFEDMHQQLLNTIEIQQLTYRLTRLKQKTGEDTDVVGLQKRIVKLKNSRRSAPPRLLVRGNRVTLQVPFLAPDKTLIQRVLGEKEYETKAGVDRGIRVPVVLSAMKGKKYRELLLKVERLVGKRELLRKQAYGLQSVTDRKKNNWERKRSGLSYPGHVLKKDRHINALWRKVRRLDREIARIVASKTVWFCEEHKVKTVFFEDLRSFQAHAGSKDLSYNLSSNLWGKIIDTVRYMRESLGHSKYSVWTVNPRYTSQTCHQCGERGKRVEDETSTTERKGGEFFYCEKCKEHFHADVNAARNIIHVHQGPSTVAGRTA